MAAEGPKCSPHWGLCAVPISQNEEALLYAGRDFSDGKA